MEYLREAKYANAFFLFMKSYEPWDTLRTADMRDWAILIVTSLLHIREGLLASSNRDGFHKRFMGSHTEPYEACSPIGLSFL